MILLPLISALIAFACTVAVGRDLIRRPRPDRATWLVAFLLFGVAAAADVIGEQWGWTNLLVRVYYLAGAVLVVGFLAIGQLYLTAPTRTAKVAPGVALLMTALSISAVWGASIDSSKLETDGWQALDRSGGLALLTIGINSIGTLILIGGLVYSAVKFRRSGTMRNRMIGCLLIASGTLTVAAGGTLTRLGSDQYLYIAMSIGIALIFFGYLWTKVPEGQAFRTPQPIRPNLAPIAVDVKTGAMGYLEGLIRGYDGPAIAEIIRIWSVPAREIDAFSRSDARRVWAFRTRLDADVVAQFDALPPAQRLQLAEVYVEVMSGEAGSDRAISPIGINLIRDDSATRTGTGSVD